MVAICRKHCSLPTKQEYCFAYKKVTIMTVVSLNYTPIGRFFSIRKLRNFLIEKRQLLIKEIASNFNTLCCLPFVSCANGGGIYCLLPIRIFAKMLKSRINTGFSHTYAALLRGFCVRNRCHYKTYTS